MNSRGQTNPHAKHNPNRLALIGALRSIAEPADLETEPLWKTQVWRLRLAFHRHVIGEFWRGLGDPEAELLYSIYRFTKTNTKVGYTKWVKHEAELWVKIWLAMEKIAQLFPQITAPEMVFQKIILEQKLVHLGLNFTGSTQDGVPPAQAMIRVHQEENKRLRSYDNPFLENDCEFTYAFIGQVMKVAVTDSTFATEYYRPIIKARTKLQDFLEKNNPIRFLPNPQTGKLEKYDQRTPKIVSKMPEKPSK